MHLASPSHHGPELIRHDFSSHAKKITALMGPYLHCLI